MDILMYIGGGITVATLFFFFRLRRRFNAALNVFFARYTYDRLNRNDKVKVKEEAKALVMAKGLKIDGYEHDVERFGWYAVAMNSLGIPSKMPENPNWHKVKNPSKILKKHDMILVKARNLIKQHYSIDIQI